MSVKIRSLTTAMQTKSHVLSLALSLSTIVVLVGIFGLVVVANHRQKRKRQLKAILRWVTFFSMKLVKKKGAWGRYSIVSKFDSIVVVMKFVKIFSIITEIGVGCLYLKHLKS